MEKFDSLRPDNQVNVIIWGPDDFKLYEGAGTGYRSIGEAIQAALDNAGLTVNPEDCVFEVTNKTSGVSHRYRINAHGNLKLIV